MAFNCQESPTEEGASHDFFAVMLFGTCFANTAVPAC